MKRLLVYLLIALSSAAITSCSDPLKDVNINYIIPPSKAIATFNFINANRNSNNIYPAGLSISYIGSDNYWEPALPTGRVPNWILDISGSNAPQPDPNSPLKVVAVGFDRNIIPTAAKPIRFTIVAKAPGFVTTSYAVEIADTGFFRFSISMVELASPPQGIGVVTGSTNQTATGTALPLSMETVSTTDKPEKVRLNIPASTIMYDAALNPVLGAVTVNVAQFDPRNETALSAFPGGLQPHTAVDRNGQPMGPISFVTAGLVNIKMATPSKVVKSFSQPVDVAIEVNDALINPISGQPVQPGQQVPLWSLDDDTGVWTLEDTLTFVRSTSSGKLEARFGIMHLSSYNLDWYGARCAQPFVLNVNGNSDQLKAFSNIRLKLYNATTNTLVSTINVSGVELTKNPKITIYNAPLGRFYFNAEYLNFFDWTFDKDPGNSTTFECGQNAIYDLQPPSINPSETKIRAELAGTCSENPRIRVYPTTEIWFLKEGEKEWQSAGWMSTGLLEGSAERGANYQFVAFHDGQMHSFDVSIPNAGFFNYANTFLMSFKYCSGIR